MLSKRLLISLGVFSVIAMVGFVTAGQASFGVSRQPAPTRAIWNIHNAKPGCYDCRVVRA